MFLVIISEELTKEDLDQLQNFGSVIGYIYFCYTKTSHAAFTILFIEKSKFLETQLMIKLSIKKKVYHYSVAPDDEFVNNFKESSSTYSNILKAIDDHKNTNTPGGFHNLIVLSMRYGKINKELFKDYDPSHWF